jgi:transcriptional regulator with XRE-family HTH domain
MTTTTTSFVARGPLEASFAKQIIHAMDGANLTSAQLAKAILVSPTAISNYCLGKHLPRPESLQKLETVLGVKFVLNDPDAEYALTITKAPQSKIHAPLTMADAKAGLALHYGVPPEDISITIKG